MKVSLRANILRLFWRILEKELIYFIENWFLIIKKCMFYFLYSMMIWWCWCRCVTKKPHHDTINSTAPFTLVYTPTKVIQFWRQFVVKLSSNRFRAVAIFKYFYRQGSHGAHRSLNSHISSYWNSFL